MQTTPITVLQTVNIKDEEMWAVEPSETPRRVISLCVLLVVSFIAAAFPTMAKRASYLQTPRVVFFIGKHFGTGVILATAFIHLLKDAFANMSKAHVNSRWGKYESWPGLIIMSALLFIFLVEYTSTVYVEYIAEQSTPSEPQESRPQNGPAAPKRPGLEHAHTDCLHGEVHVSEREATRIVGVFVLQLGIMLHSIVVGFTLAVTNGAEFTSLLIALIFHQLFEGLSLGIRISSLRPTLFAPHHSVSSGTEASPLLPSSSHRSKTHAHSFPTLPLLLASLFALATPAGMLVGIILRTAPQDAYLVRGLASAVSAGLLIYASCVELLAGDFVADPKMRKAGLKRQAAALGSLLAGAAGMAIIGIWS
ncbi:Zinc-regulated transporter 1 OS=Saccharomyces cerevisiae (strain ATCC 204508 / S288c) GN=ZRT1 PE=2 SV=1 [Rhizoctonia solani AG-1 IB]|uniref:Zinc-regulated transporter 1 n=1 Tax=Thanatephorus cucumeris (strain AG1-IB / isolate 7/3/14) TaxID=1108050 RepID=A0A0B7FA09_THACB|nr:Zinc-regulated transporter 1 OS=Saccharomyces cerevisiae (strain ATCC 204508 / S288c) GN=ZRT1 PE=2 SV=1 [Rhizoctonia solani AG-1 IB]